MEWSDQVTVTMRSREIRSVGLRTRVLEAGPSESNEAVVFVHGVPGSANSWDDLLPRVGAFARAVAFDLPGFGQADKPAHWEYSSNSYANFIAGVVNALGLARVHLVIHDLGGVALFWAAAHPDAFASAVVIDTGVLIGYRWHAIARLFRAPVIGRIAVNTGRFAFRAVMGRYNRPRQKLSADIIERWRDDYDRGARRALLRFYRATPSSMSADLAPTLRSLDRPALAVWGAHDPFVPVEQAERQRDSFPSADVVVLEDSGHYPYLDDPQAVADAVVPFLRRVLVGEPIR